MIVLTDCELKVITSVMNHIMNSRTISVWEGVAAMYDMNIKTIEILDKNRVKIVMVINGNPFEFIYAKEV